jgi:hypothetical protein
MIEEAQAAPDTEHSLRVMDPQAGDIKTTWDPDNDDEVDAAEAQFDKMKAKGFAAYRVGKDGEQTTIMRTFDPDARAIIMAPPVAGG